MKPLSPVPAQTIPHPPGPVPRQFPVRGDPSAPRSPLLRTLELGSGEALISQSEPGNKRVGVNTRLGKLLAKERWGDKMGRADPWTSLLAGDRVGGMGGRSTDPHCLRLHRGAPQRFCTSPWRESVRPGDLEGGEGSCFQMLLANRSCCVSVPPCPGLHVPPGECSLLPSSTPWQHGGGWAPASLASRACLVLTSKALCLHNGPSRASACW